MHHAMRVPTCLVGFVLNLLFELCLTLDPAQQRSSRIGPSLGRTANCFPRRSTAPSITEVADCGVAVREMISQGSRAADPVVWGPGIDYRIGWVWGSCVIVLLPNSVQSFDSISRLKLAEAATTLVTTCATQAYGYKGGLIKVGPKGVFHLTISGKSRRSGSDGEAR